MTTSICNTVYPDPDSFETSLDILKIVCESKAVSVIGEFAARIDNIILQSLKVCVSNYRRPNYELQTGLKARQNKIEGLYIENEDDAKIRIKEPRILYDLGKIKIYSKTYYIEPGLTGIRKIVKYSKYLENNQQDLLPEYLKNLDFELYNFHIGIIRKIQFLSI